MKKRTLVILLAAVVLLPLVAFYFMAPKSESDGLQGTALQVTRDYRNWMTLTPEIRNKRLSEITFPATHDSGTWTFLNEISPERETKQLSEGLAKIDNVVDGIAKIKIAGTSLRLDAGITQVLRDDAIETFYEATKDLARCTDNNIGQQLDQGIRWLDLRIYLRDGGPYTHHALTGVDMNSVVDSVYNFLATTKGEILVLEMSHFVGNDGNYDDFINNMRSKLENYAYQKKFENGGVTNNPFDKTYEEVVGKTPSSKVIMIMDGEPGDKNAKSDLVFWKYDQLGIKTGEYNYSNTTDGEKMISDQVEKFNKAKSAGDTFTLFYTLTSNADDGTNIVLSRMAEELPAKLVRHLLAWLPDALIHNRLYNGEEQLTEKVTEIVKKNFNITPIKYRSIKELSQRINPDLQKTLEQRFQSTSTGNNNITVIYADYFENTLLVDTAIKYSSLPSRYVK